MGFLCDFWFDFTHKSKIISLKIQSTKTHFIARPNKKNLIKIIEMTIHGNNVKYRHANPWQESSVCNSCPGQIISNEKLTTNYNTFLCIPIILLFD